MSERVRSDYPFVRARGNNDICYRATRVEPCQKSIRFRTDLPIINCRAGRRRFKVHIRSRVPIPIARLLLTLPDIWYGRSLLTPIKGSRPIVPGSEIISNDTMETPVGIGARGSLVFDREIPEFEAPSQRFLREPRFILRIIRELQFLFQTIIVRFVISSRQG